ncbi:MAG: DUF4405 domain-containing protein [Chloroflexi bacterium]|nr:MAG: DUF4405 domain-containing protein [Chloroflexota bacterium]
MNKAKRNYYVDTVIGIMFLVVTVSAVVFLIPTSWIDFSASTTPTVLGLDFGIWQTLHKWAGIAMLIGIAVHQLLHWDWIVVMTKRMMPGLSLSKPKQASSSPFDAA